MPHPIRELFEPLSGRANRNEGSGLTPADLFCSVSDMLPNRVRRTRTPDEEQNSTQKPNCPDEG